VPAIRQFIFGFDIDGVLTNDDDGQNNIWLETASTYFGEPIQKAAYHVEEAFNKTREEVEEFFQACIEEIFTSVPVRDYAPETLRALAERGGIIHLITHRDTRHRQITETWLRRHGIPYHSLTMCPTGYGYSKKERCLELGVQFFVDDKLENAEEVASSGHLHPALPRLPQRRAPHQGAPGQGLAGGGPAYRLLPRSAAAPSPLVRKRSAPARPGRARKNCTTDTVPWPR